VTGERKKGRARARNFYRDAAANDRTPLAPPEKAKNGGQHSTESGSKPTLTYRRTKNFRAVELLFVPTTAQAPHDWAGRRRIHEFAAGACAQAMLLDAWQRTLDL
jgi:hypothetical protein